MSEFDDVTRTEFQRLQADFDRLFEENAKLRAENQKLHTLLAVARARPRPSRLREEPPRAPVMHRPDPRGFQA